MKKQLYILGFICLAFSCNNSDDSVPQNPPTPTPPTLQTVQATNVSSESAVAGGTMIEDNGKPITAKGLCWSVQPNIPTIDDSTTDEGAGTDDFTSTLMSLDSHTDYFVRAYAINEDGVGYGDKINVSTPFAPDEAPCLPDENSLNFDGTPLNFTTSVVLEDVENDYYTLRGTNGSDTLNIVFKVPPSSGIYTTAFVGTQIQTSECIVVGTFGPNSIEYLIDSEFLVYVTQNGEDQYSVTFCDQIFYSLPSYEFQFTSSGNLTSN